MAEPVKGALRVWWIPQVPMDPFYVPVKNLREAKLVVDTLARYDIFQHEKHVKPDFFNAGGLQEFDGEDWIEWHDPETDVEFYEYVDSHPEL